MTTILVVEDDRATTGLLKTIFGLENYRTIVCAQPDRVIPTVRDQRPDLVFMDFHLAEVESLSILEELKADPELKAIPVVMTSGLDRSAACEKAGAAGFIIKPFRPANLLDMIRGALGGKE